MRTTIEVPGQVTFQWEVAIPVPDPATVTLVSVSLAITAILGVILRATDY